MSIVPAADALVAVNPVPWARVQMAFTLGAHIILVPLGVSWAFMTLIANYRGLKKNEPESLILAQRWSKYMAVTFAVGAVSGTAIQLSDLTRDYTVYLEVTTAGTATSLTIGPTSSANAVSLMTSQAATAGQVITFRLPAGWYFKWTGTTTAVGNQVAVGC